jgi:hypothetical protein
MKPFSPDGQPFDVLVTVDGGAAAASGAHFSPTLVQDEDYGRDHKDAGQNHRNLCQSSETLPLAAHVGLGAAAEYSGETALFSLLKEHDPRKGYAEYYVDYTEKGLHQPHLLIIETGSGQIAILS